MTISLIAAMTKNRVIGYNNTLPWDLPDDFRHFKRTTLYKPVIMGRATFDSLGGPLPGRQNIIITRNEALRIKDCDIVHSLQEALILAGEAPEVMIAGGAQVYALALPLADRLYLTIIDCELGGDAFFPEFDLSEWNETARVDHPADEKHEYAFQFLTLERK